MYQLYRSKANRFSRFFKTERGTAIPVFCASTAIGFVAALAINGTLMPKDENVIATPALTKHFYASPLSTQSTAQIDAIFSTSPQEEACRIDAYHDVRRKLSADDSLQESLALHIRKTYRISLDTAERIVKNSIELSNEYDADPLLLLGIIAKESSFNTTAKSSYGAAGLMQVYAPSHKKLLEELGVNMQNRKMIDKTLLSELDLNMTAGTRIFKQYERQYGTVEKALQAYNGARTDTSFKYARKVLALRESFYDYLATRIQTDDMDSMLNFMADDATLHTPHFMKQQVRYAVDGTAG